MARFEIPTKDTKLFIQPNRGEQFGNLYASFNLDFDSTLGKVRTSRRAIIRTDSTDDADLGLPAAFIRTSADATDRWWALCGTVLFKNTAGASPSASAFTQDAIISTPTDLTAISSDMVEFNGALIVSDSTDLNRLSTTWDAAWWITTLAQTALTGSIAHPLHVSVKSNILCIGDGNLLHTIDKNNNVRASRVILPSEFEIIWIRSNYDGTYIGARNKFQREAKAFFWDESAENYNRGYGLKDEMTFACVIKDGIPYVINGAGQLLKFTGVGFEEAAVFPVFQQPNTIWSDDYTVRRSVNRNGMAVIEGKIHINISSYLTAILASNILDNFPSGIWTYDEKQGLRHKYGLSLYRVATGTEMDYGAYLTPAAGALVPTENSQGLFLVGGTVGSSATVNVPAILYRDTAETNIRGHFITSIFESSAFEDVFKDILLTFKRFKNSGDRLIVKYRTIKNVNYPLQGVGTFTSTTVFTATTLALGDMANAVAGDEVMILRGRGAGTVTKISSVTEAGGTYTVTLAEAITNASGTMLFRMDDWTEAAIISTQGIERQGFDLDAVGTFIQLKVELRTVSGGVANMSDSPILEKIIVNSSPEMVE